MVCRFVSGVPSGRTNNYPESWRGLGHVTPTIFGIRSNISLKLLEVEISNLIHGFAWAMPSRRVNNFPESRRGLGHVTLTIFGSTVGYPSDSLASCYYCLTGMQKTPCVSHKQITDAYLTLNRSFLVKYFKDGRLTVHIAHGGQN